MRDGVSEYAIKPTITKLKQRIAAGEVLSKAGSLGPTAGTERLQTQRAANAVAAELRRRGIRSDTQYGHFWYNLMMEYSALAGSPVPMFTMMKKAYDDFQNEALTAQREEGPTEDGRSRNKVEGLDALLLWGAGDTDEESPGSTSESDDVGRATTRGPQRPRGPSAKAGQRAEVTTGSDNSVGHALDYMNHEVKGIASDDVSDTASFFTPEQSPTPTEAEVTPLIKEDGHLARGPGSMAKAVSSGKAPGTGHGTLEKKKRRRETAEMSEGVDETGGVSHARKRLRVASSVARDGDGLHSKLQARQSMDGGGRSNEAGEMTAHEGSRRKEKKSYAGAWKKLNKLHKAEQLHKAKKLARKVKAKKLARKVKAKLAEARQQQQIQALAKLRAKGKKQTKG
jgi:hypothetical protein